MGDASRFLTLTAPASGRHARCLPSCSLCHRPPHRGRRGRGCLDASASAAADEPLLELPQCRCTRVKTSRCPPSAPCWVPASTATPSKAPLLPPTAAAARRPASDSADTSTDLSQAASEMQQRTDALLASADKLMAGLTDVAGFGQRHRDRPRTRALKAPCPSRP